MTAMSMQAWPEDALEDQPKRSCLSEVKTPSLREEHNSSATAHEEPNYPHPHMEMQVRMLMVEHLLLEQCPTSTLPLLHALSHNLQVLMSCIRSSQLMHIWLKATHLNDAGS